MTSAMHEPNPTDVSTWFDDALPRLFGYFIVRVGGRVDIAEDLTQETVLAAVKSASGPSGDNPVMAWLYGIARHKLVDHYRSEDQERRQVGPRDPDLLDTGPSPPLGHLDLDAIHTRTPGCERSLWDPAKSHRRGRRAFAGCPIAGWSNGPSPGWGGTDCTATTMRCCPKPKRTGSISR